jgi:muramidase (phage lysozyme)
MERADRRKVQVAAQPIAPLPRVNSPRRKQHPVNREEIVQQLIQKQEAVAQLEEKGRRHAHQVHGSISSTSTSSTCVVDEQIEQDITELRQEVKVLEKMLPERAVPPPKYI